MPGYNEHINSLTNIYIRIVDLYNCESFHLLQWFHYIMSSSMQRAFILKFMKH